MTTRIFIAPFAPARAAMIAVARQFVGALVHGVAGMALDPVPVHLVARRAPRRAAATDRRSSPASCRRCASRCASSRGSSSMMPLRRYSLSVCRSTVHGRFSASSAAIAAISSMRLLVVCGSPPFSSFSCSPKVRIAPQPPGPGIARAGAVGVDDDVRLASCVRLSVAGRSRATLCDRLVEAQLAEIFQRVLRLDQRARRGTSSQSTSRVSRKRMAAPRASSGSASSSAADSGAHARVGARAARGPW